MKTCLECIPCFFRQALLAARAATEDEAVVKEVLDRVAAHVPRIPMDQTPPEVARGVYAAVREVTGVCDPFAAHKEESIRKSLALYPELKGPVEEAEMGVVRKGRLAIDHHASFQQYAEAARTALYLGDNAGETVFEAADIIVSKGQGNFESLSGVDAPVFFLLKTKCPVIARHLGTRSGDTILKDARGG